MRGVALDRALAQLALAQQPVGRGERRALSAAERLDHVTLRQPILGLHAAHELPAGGVDDGADEADGEGERPTRHVRIVPVLLQHRPSRRR